MVMKKKTKIILLILSVVAVFMVGVIVWWLSPKYFLDNIKSEEIASIEVFNGNDGNRFSITGKNDIVFILDHIQSVPMKKDRISMGTGTTYNLRFLNKNGNEIDKFIIMSATTIRSGLIFYECDGKLQQVEDYLISLERVRFPDTDWAKEQD